MSKIKTLIVYASKTGTTEKCAKLLAEKLNDCDINNISEGTSDISNYDIVVIGGSIRMGMLHKEAKKYIIKNKELLKSKIVIYFVCSGFVDDSNKYFENNIPGELLAKAKVCMCFGGELNVLKLHGLEKFVAKMVSKANEDNKLPQPKIIYENIEKLAAIINEIK